MALVTRAAILLAVLAASCGGSATTPTTPGNPANPYTFTLTSAGVSPKELTVPPGTRVAFVNNDSRRHDMASDPHPEHDLCRELNGAALNPGQSRESLNLVEAKTCGFHDHDNPPPGGTIWTGRIVIR
jgi:plastocyanin